MEGTAENHQHKNKKVMFCFLMILTSGSIYKLKSNGPKMYPWGTPQRRETDKERNWPTDTIKDRDLRYDSNQWSAVPLMLTHWWRCDKRILWSTISKAALKSYQIKTTVSPESTANNKSFITFNSAVSVLWWVVKPYWILLFLLYFICKGELMNSVNL